MGYIEPRWNTHTAPVLFDRRAAVAKAASRATDGREYHALRQ